LRKERQTERKKEIKSNENTVRHIKERQTDRKREKQKGRKTEGV